MIKQMSCVPEPISLLEREINLGLYRGWPIGSAISDLQQKVKNLFRHPRLLKLENLGAIKSSGEEKLHIFMGREIMGYLFVRWQDDRFMTADFFKEGKI